MCDKILNIESHWWNVFDCTLQNRFVLLLQTKPLENVYSYSFLTPMHSDFHNNYSSPNIWRFPGYFNDLDILQIEYFTKRKTSSRYVKYQSRFKKKPGKRKRIKAQKCHTGTYQQWLQSHCHAAKTSGSAVIPT